MRTLGSMFAETYASWLNSISLCCPPLASRIDRELSIEKPVGVFREQPGLVPPPSAEPLWLPEREGCWNEYGNEYEDEDGDERAARKRSNSSRSHFSVRRFMSNVSPSRRPQISAPSNFRHLYSESFQFPSPGSEPPQRPASFHPLELSIYASSNRLSPIIPQFDIDDHIPPLPAAHTHGRAASDDSSATLTHERSYSSMPFYMPRRQVLEEDSSFTSSPESTPPRIPPRSRARAYTAPSVERIVERIASAMIEKERLQSEIDSIIERQSIYMSSRPSTAYGVQDLEPMPSIPALPAAAPSFAERLSTEGRPQTAPAQPIHIPRRETSFAEASAAFGSAYRQVRDDLDRPLAPPLPLVLRPPLRKKKSFSRVSNWLFPGAEADRRDISLDPITNLPRPLNGREGYYQCVSPEGRTSVDTATTVSTWETGEEGQTVPTTLSPGSSPVVAQGTLKVQTPTAIYRTATFGRGSSSHRSQSVGVAF